MCEVVACFDIIKNEMDFQPIQFLCDQFPPGSAPRQGAAPEATLRSPHSGLNNSWQPTSPGLCRPWVVEEQVTRGGGGGNGKGRGKGKGKGNGKGNGQGGGNGGGQGGETVRTYTYGNYIDEPITMTSSGAGPSGTYYYHTNNLYNVRALTDSGGNVVERYRYTAYGEPTILDDAGSERARSAVGNPYMFQGRRMDSETGLYYYRNRYYSATLGRFVTRDPMGYFEGYNLYEYVNTRPNLRPDPMGLGVLAWMLTGEWEPEKSALNAAGGSYIRNAFRIPGTDWSPGNLLYTGSLSAPEENVLRAAAQGGREGVGGFNVGVGSEGGATGVAPSPAAPPIAVGVSVDYSIVQTCGFDKSKGGFYMETCDTATVTGRLGGGVDVSAGIGVVATGGLRGSMAEGFGKNYGAGLNANVGGPFTGGGDLMINPNNLQGTLTIPRIGVGSAATLTAQFSFSCTACSDNPLAATSRLMRVKNCVKNTLAAAMLIIPSDIVIDKLHEAYSSN